MLWILEETNTTWNKTENPKISPHGYNKSVYYKENILIGSKLIEYLRNDVETIGYPF